MMRNKCEKPHVWNSGYMEHGACLTSICCISKEEAQLQTLPFFGKNVQHKNEKRFKNMAAKEQETRNMAAKVIFSETLELHFISVWLFYNIQ